MADDERHDLKDAEWALLESLLPDRTPRRGGCWSDHRMILDAVRWRVRTGCPWRDLPQRFGPWQTVYSRHRRWCADGTWAAVLERLRVEADTDPEASDERGAWQVAVDSTAVRAHADAAGARHEPPKDVPAQLLEELAAAVPAGPVRGSTQPSARSSGSPPPQGSPSSAGASSPATRPDDQAATTRSGGAADADGAGHGGDGDGAAGGVSTQQGEGQHQRPDDLEQRRAQRRHLKVVREGARAREGLGRSRGGLTSKIHLAADRKMRVLAHAISPGQRADPRGFAPVMARLRIARRGPGRPRTRPDVVLGDKAYSSTGIRAHLRRRGIEAVIPVKDDQAAARAKKGSRGGRPPAFDADTYRERNTVERAVARLKRFRAVALRSGKRLYVYNGTVTVGAISLWLRDLTR